MDLDLRFTIDEELFGQVCSASFLCPTNQFVTFCVTVFVSPIQTHQHELTPGGAEIVVTNENKKEYIQ